MLSSAGLFSDQSAGPMGRDPPLSDTEPVAQRGRSAPLSFFMSNVNRAAIGLATHRSTLWRATSGPSPHPFFMATARGRPRHPRLSFLFPKTARRCGGRARDWPELCQQSFQARPSPPPPPPSACRASPVCSSGAEITYQLGKRPPSDRKVGRCGPPPAPPPPPPTSPPCQGDFARGFWVPPAQRDWTGPPQP